RGGGFASVSVHKILHRLLEALIAVAVVAHHHADHVQHVSALRVNGPPVGSATRPSVVGAISHGQGADVNGTIALDILLEQQLALVIPEGDRKSTRLN